jgi:hypothetical protein
MTKGRYGVERLVVKRVALAVLLVAGCASMRGLTPGQAQRLADFDREDQIINERENRCISQALKSNDRPRTGARPGDSNDLQKQISEPDGNRRLLACITTADRAREKLSERERAIYAYHLQEEQDRDSLMMILITSRPH